MANISAQSQLGTFPDEARISGINPTVELQHPGFYYYIAAVCTTKRRDQFRIVMDQEVSRNSANVIYTMLELMLDS